jgi:hypothetical protein
MWLAEFDFAAADKVNTHHGNRMVFDEDPHPTGLIKRSFPDLEWLGSGGSDPGGTVLTHTVHEQSSGRLSRYRQGMRGWTRGKGNNN